MGVKDLWTVLEPVCEQCSLGDLQGKRVAVDVSGWIYQAKECQQLAGKDSLKPHLRVLFWRVYHLIRNHVQPVFVFDGPTVQLKKLAVQRRNSKVNNSDKFSKEFRSKFSRWNKECKEMLCVLRVPYIESSGDAEAACAQLNEIGEVDGCISDDSDCFLFGADVVYTHFSCDETKVESMRCYRMSKIRDQLGLDRQKLVALALLLGCDYGLEGVRGIGKEQAMRLMNGWANVDPLERMKSWRTDGDICRLISFDTKKPEHCRRCRHIGSLNEHKKLGCQQCSNIMSDHSSGSLSHSPCGATSCVSRDETERCACNWHQMSAEYQGHVAEIKISTAALKDPTFPNSLIISAYLDNSSLPENRRKFEWLRPSYSEAEGWLVNVFSGWTMEKVRSILMSYLTAIDMLTVVSDPHMDALNSLSRPDRIKSRGKKHGRQLYEVIWKTIEGVPEIPDTKESLITWEFKNIFCAAFPSVAAKHEEWLSDKEDTPKGKKRKSTEDDLPANQPTIKEFFRARKRLNFDSVAKSSSSAEHTASATAAATDSDCELIMVPECQ